MKKSVLFAAFVLSVLIFAACNKPAEKASGAAEVFNIKFGSTGNDEHQYTVYGKYFKEKLEELAKGQITVTIYPNSSLGSEREMVESARLGTLEMCCVTADATPTAWVPEAAVLSIPYLFASKEDAYFVLDGVLQNYMAPLFEQQMLVHLNYAELGFRHFTNNKRPVVTAADMAGMSIRVQEAPIWFALMKTLNATATPVPFNELYTAMQQGMVDGEENPIASVYSMKFYEVQKYMCLDGHTYAAGSALMNKAFFDKLPANLQNAVKEAAAYARDAQRKDVNEKELSMLQEMKNKGLQITDADVASFQKATADLYRQPEVQKLVNPELVELVKKTLAER